jgi:transcriptional regulator with XRE-family HTH domain
MPNNMRLERVARFLTLDQVAKDVGIHPNTLARWERGEVEPTASNVVELARYYHVSVEYLLGYAEDRAATAVAD